MEYRELPHGKEIIGTIGLGLANIDENNEKEVEEMLEVAFDNGVNFYDMCCGEKTYQALKKAIKGQREKILIQSHFGAVYTSGEYEWSRDLEKIKKQFETNIKALDTDYVDFGMLHCIDEINDFESEETQVLFNYMLELKEQGVIKHLGFSSHTPVLANHLLDTGKFDLMMFSLNPPYDYELYDSTHSIGLTDERSLLYQRCAKEGVAISVMKPLFRGKLLDAKQSPFKKAMTFSQCIQYCLDKPAVVTTLPGASNLKDIKDLVQNLNPTEAEKDYSILGSFDIAKVTGNCIYCEHCAPCPMGIKVGQVNKFYDLAKIGDKQAISHYHSLDKKADDCISCGHCDARCPFKVKQVEKMQIIKEYFNNL